MTVKRFVFMMLLFLTACGPQPTPFPADIPLSVTSTSEVSTAAPIRYALAMNTQDYVADLDAIRASAQVEQLTEPVNPADLGTRYDLIAAYGELPGGTRSPIELHAALVLNTGNVLNNPALQAVIRRAVHPQIILDSLNISGALAEPLESVDTRSLRADLANSGWPDGISLNMAYAYTPGFDGLIQQFEEAGIEIQSHLMKKADIPAALDDNRVQMALINWGTPDERSLWTAHFGESQVIDLYTIPISYQAIPGLNVTFTSDGWPLANR